MEMVKKKRDGDGQEAQDSRGGGGRRDVTETPSPGERAFTGRYVMSEVVIWPTVGEQTGHHWTKRGRLDRLISSLKPSSSS